MLVSNSISIPSACSLFLVSSNISSIILSISFSVSLWNTIISSILFINSGLKVFFNSPITCFLVSSYCFFSSSSLPVSKPNFLFSAINLAPTFDVIIITEFLKSTVLPVASVNLPSSNI